MLYKTDIKLTENERLSISSKYHACSFYSSRLFVLSFVLCLFLSFSVASADEMAYNQQETIENYISSEIPSLSSSIISAFREHVFPYCQYFGTYKTSSPNAIIINFVSDLSVMPVDMHSSWSSPPCQFQVGISNTYGSRGGLVSLSSKSLSNYYGFRFIFYNNTWTLKGVKNYTGSVSNKYGDTYFGGGSLVKYAGTSSQGNSSWFNPWSITWTKSFGYGPVWIASSSDRQYVIYSSNNTEPILYTEDNRLKLYTTQSASQGSLLHVDLSEFYQYNNGASSNYSFSDVVLTLDCDGTENSFTLSPFGSQYEFLDTSTSSTRVYGYIVPYSFFSVSEYQNCSVVKVDFTRTISSPGGSGTENFKISCSYPLKVTNINGNSQDFAPVTLAPVPSVTVVPDQSDVQDWSYNTTYHSPSFGHNGSYVLLNSLPIFPDWVDKYTLDCTRVNKTVDGITLNLWIDLDNPYVSVNTALVDIPITAFFTPESYLKDNILTDFYDVVVFKVWSDIGKTSVDGYLYFYTEKYDLKYQNNLIVQELSLEYDSLNLLSSGFSLIRTGLDNIDNNTSAFFTDSLFNDTIVISWLQTLNNTNSFGFTDVINAIEDIPQYDDTSVLSGIASVVSAIEGIDSPDLSDLESKLDTLINFFVADGSTENASSRTYRNWLRGVDDNTQRTVTYYADNVFSIVHDVFDLFDADGSVYYPPDSEDVVSTDYINFVKLFIEKMNSSTITNTEYNKYLRGFFQGGFDPHLIDGGL